VENFRQSENITEKHCLVPDVFDATPRVLQDIADQNQRLAMPLVADLLRGPRHVALAVLLGMRVHADPRDRAIRECDLQFRGRVVHPCFLAYRIVIFVRVLVELQAHDDVRRDDDAVDQRILLGRVDAPVVDPIRPLRDAHTVLGEEVEERGLVIEPHGAPRVVGIARQAVLATAMDIRGNRARDTVVAGARLAPDVYHARFLARITAHRFSFGETVRCCFSTRAHLAHDIDHPRLLARVAALRFFI